LARSAGYSMSRVGIAMSSDPCGDFAIKGPFTLPGAVGTGRCCLTRNLLCYSRTLGDPRTFQQASVERGTMDAVAGCGRSSLPGAATALYHASIAAAAT